MSRIALSLFLLIGVAACEPLDTSALQKIEETAAQTRANVEVLNVHGQQLQAIADDPAAALQVATLGARLVRTPTDQTGVFVLTDVANGCQYLATYAADGAKVASIAPRTELVGGVPRQRCVRAPSISEAPPTGGEPAVHTVE